jgi:hypothetical protein
MAGGKIIYNVINKADFKNNPALIFFKTDPRLSSANYASARPGFELSRHNGCHSIIGPNKNAY